MNVRNSIIDVTKGVGIILVAFGHNWIVLHNKGELFNIIFSFHMPLFFFLSGIFIKDHTPLKSFLFDRANSLLKPYFFVMIFLWFIVVLLDILSYRFTLITNIKNFLGIFYATGYSIAWSKDWWGLWFPPHLFISLIFSLLIIKSIPDNNLFINRLISVVILLVGIYFMSFFWMLSPIQFGSIKINPKIGMPWSVDLLLITSSFIILGHSFAKNLQTIKFNAFGFIIALIVFFYLHYKFNETIDLNKRIYKSPVVSTLQAYAGIYICLNLSIIFKKYTLLYKSLEYIGKASLFILLFHVFFQLKSFSVLSRICGQSILSGLLSLSIGILIPLIIFEVTKRSIFLSAVFLPKKAIKVS